MQLDWEIWVDMHFSPIISKWLQKETDWNVKSFYFLKLNTEDDITIYKKAKSSGKIILVSKDSDFPEIISRLGSPPKLIKVNIGNCSNKILWKILKKEIISAVKILSKSKFDIVEIE